MVEAVFSLDLGPIKFKLMDANEGYGWTREEADRRELEYKRFLALVAKYPGEAIVPNKEVDRFWHAHILDTMKYAEDCHKVFGYFLHHFPYFGMRDEEDAANLANASEKTQALYRQEFGTSEQQGTAYCGVAAAAYCGAAAENAGAAYCGVAADKSTSAYCGVAAGTAAYCGVAADKAASAYCGVAAPAYCGVVTAKGRPVLDEAAA